MNQEAIYKHIGDVIKKRRKHLGLTQEDLSKQLAISRASLANIETGRQNFPVHQLYSIAKALAMAPMDLLPAPAENGSRKVDESLSFSTTLSSKQKDEITRFITGSF